VISVAARITAGLGLRVGVPCGDVLVELGVVGWLCAFVFFCFLASFVLVAPGCVATHTGGAQDACCDAEYGQAVSAFQALGQVLVEREGCVERL
jgi:hypothetical protein